MRKLFIALMLLLLLVLPVMAGEYQPESIEYERAFAAGNYADAVDLARTKVGKGNALNAQGLDAYNAGDYEKALELLDQAIALDPDQYWAHNTKGAILLYQGKVALAIASFERSVQANAKANDDEAGLRVLKAQRNIETAKLYQ